MNTTKFVWFSFKDKDGEVLHKTHFVYEKGMNWLELEKALKVMLSEVTGRDEMVSASILTNEWVINKEFTNGMHFFIKYKNDWGFTSAYLYKE